MKKNIFHIDKLVLYFIGFGLIIILSQGCNPFKENPEVHLYGPRGMDMDRVVYIDLIKFNDFDSLLNHVDEINCNDSIAVIEMVIEGMYKYIRLSNLCSRSSIRFSARNSLIIQDEKCNRNEFSLFENPEFMLEQFIKNPNNREDYSDNPKRAFIIISYDTLDIEGLPKLLDILTNAADRIEVSQHLKLILFNIPKPPPPPPGDA